MEGRQMTVVFQIAGKYKDGAGPQLAPAFELIKAKSATSAGHQRSLLLTNHTTQQFQMLFYWTGYDEGLAFHTKTYPRASMALSALVESNGTLITSRLEVQLAPVSVTQEVA
jgi:hypothetical protein